MKGNIPKPHKPSGNTVKNSIELADGTKYCCVNFRYLKPSCISQKDFNNFFRDATHYQSVISSFVGSVLPKISDLTTNELLSGGRFSAQFHFHKVGQDKYEKIKSILKAYNYNTDQINQFLDGGNIYQFAGNLEGHGVESRIICEYISGVLYILFFDTNHHLFLDRSKIGESMSFTYCPYEAGNECHNAYNCIAKEYLDIDKINSSYGYNYSPI